MKLLLSTIIFAMLSVAVLSQSTTTAPILPLCQARGVIQAILNNLEATGGSPSVILVLDKKGQEVASVRMDGVVNIADAGAAAKAKMTANLRLPSGAGTNFNFSNILATQFPIFEPGQYLFKVDEKMGMWGIGGAFPITRNGTFVGAVAVSGAATAAGDITAALAGYLVQNCISSLTVNAMKYPRLADALSRIAAAEAFAPSLAEKNYANVVVDELGRVIAGARTDLAPLISYKYATMKARTLQQLGQVNTTQSLFAQGAFDPFRASFSIDNADISLNKCPGATILRNAVGAIVGAVGSSGAMDPVGGDQKVSDAAALPSVVANYNRVPTLSLANAAGALTAALNTAFSLKTQVSVAIVDAAGEPKLYYTTPGSVPASLDHAQAKAKMAINVPFPQSVIFPLLYAQANPFTDPATLYNLAGAPGLVAYSGYGTIRDSTGNVIGGVGVFSEGNLTVDNQIAAAAVAGAANAVDPKAFVPPQFTTDMVKPGSSRYFAANVNSSAAYSACWAGFAAGSTTPGACVSRDARGKINVVVVQDGAAQSAQRFADRTSHAAFVFPWPSDGPNGAYLQAFNPYNGSYFTGSNAESPFRSVTAPGGVPLMGTSGLIVGSIGFGSSVTAGNTLDQSIGDAAVKARKGKEYFEARVTPAPTVAPTVSPTLAPSAVGNQVVKVTLNLIFSSWTVGNQTAFQQLITSILPPSFPVLLPFKYYEGSVIQEISVTSTSFNATVTNSLQFIQQQIDANKNTAAFANYKVTSVGIATAAGAPAATTSGLSGGAIAGIVIGVVAFVVFICVASMKTQQSREGDDDVPMQYKPY